jgi:hypothetical protein
MSAKEHGGDPCSACSAILGGAQACAYSHGFRPGAYETPCRCGGDGLGVNGFHYPGAHGCLLEKSTPATSPLTGIQSTLHCEWSY